MSEMLTNDTVPQSSGLNRKIHAVLLDYGQVLSRGPNPLAWERMRDIVGGAPEAFSRAYWGPRHDYDRGTLTGTAYWNEVAGMAGHPGLQEDELDELYRADVDLWTDLNEPMVAWVKELQQRGMRTGILSNIGDRMERGVRKKLDWLDDFHHCTWSHRLNMAKPEAAIYQYAAQGLGTSPEHILFIDDREENILGARSAGMVAVHYTEHEAFLAEMHRLELARLL